MIDISVGGARSIPLTIGSRSLTLEINNTSATSNGFETRQSTFTFHGNAASMPISANLAYLVPAQTGMEINAATFGHPSLSGGLFWATRPAGISIIRTITAFSSAAIVLYRSW